MGLRNEALSGKLTPLFLLVLVVCLIPLDGLAASDDVVINEIVYNPTGDEASGEWVELYNQSTSGSVDIGGWAITDQDTHDYLIPDGTSIPADGYIVIHTGSGSNTSTDLYAGFTTGIWNNSGDEVLLEDASGNGIDYIEYDGG